MVGVVAVPVLVVPVDVGVVLGLVLVGVVPLGVVEPDAGVVDEEPEVDVFGAGVVVEEVVAVLDVLLELGGLATSPLDFSAESISCCTVPTSVAIAAGVPAAPSAGSAFSCLRSAVSVSRSCCEGWALSVTTIWSASAVVTQAGQS